LWKRQHLGDKAYYSDHEPGEGVSFFFPGHLKLPVEMLQQSRLGGEDEQIRKLSRL